MTLYVDPGDVQIDNNTAENLLHAVASGRKTSCTSVPATVTSVSPQSILYLASVELGGLDSEGDLRLIIARTATRRVDRVGELSHWVEGD